MMNCAKLIRPFNLALKTEIIVTAAMRAIICNVPTITVYHRQTSAPFQMQQINGLQIELIGMPLTKIIVDHGGPATGYIKIQ
jgi:hypothetical protein